jgi:peptidoglycan/xylan/chitin deacetylase (PgdA/CDA1 family)
MVMQPFKLFKKRMSSRSIDRSILRVYSIFKAYGWNGQPFKQSLLNFVRLIHKYNIQATFPVTAMVLDKHPNLFQHIQNLGIELAIHGYAHVDYSNLDTITLVDHLKNAKKIFGRHNIAYTGFRYPYLSKRDHQIEQLADTNFNWDSSHVVSWNLLRKEMFSKKKWLDYQTILESYHADDEASFFVLPYFIKDMVEIPVSVPDDDILIQRLQLRNGELMRSVWKEMLNKTVRNHELMVLQLHPERFHSFRFALEHLIQLSQEKKKIWTASLGAIADWWRERSRFKFQITPVSKTQYRIHANASNRATILMKDGFINSKRKIDGYGVVKEKSWEISSRAKPIIGIQPKSDKSVFAFLKNEGFPCETISDPSQEYACTVNYRGKLLYHDQKKLLQKIRDSRYPVVRFWRWPNQNDACLSVTGDIDGVDVCDFIMRFYGKTES